MGKVKNGPKKGIPGKQKAPESKKVLNPFEVHVNRQKFPVLGRKLKNDRGLPGVSRAKALKKRKATLLQEYKQKDKSNKFMDHRIGERNSAMTSEDRISARFTAERMKAHNKKAIFNLADDEVLTHRGQTLSEIEKFEDPRSDEDDEDDFVKSKGNLNSDFVGDAHFGGGLLSHSEDGGSKSRKDLIDQLIFESKKRKAEQQRQREQTLGLTEKLDGEWKDLLPIISAAPKAAEVEKPKPDSYDIVMRELKFEARGKPSDRLKSCDEIALEEKEKLENLEAERLRRMHGVIDAAESSTSKHRSADDLDDGFEIDDDDDDDDDDEDQDKDQDEGDNGMESEGENDAPSDAQSEDGAESDQDENMNEEDKDDMNESGEEDESDIDDLKYDSSSEEEEEDVKIKAGPEIDKKVADLIPTKHVLECAGNHMVATENFSTSESSQKKTEKIREELHRRKEVMEAARRELPYTFEMPATYEELQKTLCGREPEYQGVIVERMIKCSHPSLAAGNKQKLASLFAFLMQHLHDAATSDDSENICWAVLSHISHHLFDITQWCPNEVSQCIRDILQEKQQEFRRTRKQFPGVETLIYFKVISLLFPTSDYRHPVVTPALVFMGQMLSLCRVRSRQDIARGMLLTSLMLEYTALSKRFSPEAINFLRNLLYTATSFSVMQKNANPSQLPEVRLIPPFKMHAPECSLLRPENEKKRVKDVAERLQACDLTSSNLVDDAFRHTTLLNVLRMLSSYLSQLEPLAACRQIFSPFTPLLNSLLQESWLPACIRKETENVQQQIDTINKKKLEYLVAVLKRPKPLKLYEPKITQVYADGKQRRPMSKEKQDHEKLLHRYKRERKGALREIRKDRDFLAKIKIKQQLKSDVERRAKVKEIFGDAAMQQGEMRKLSRSKK